MMPGARHGPSRSMMLETLTSPTLIGFIVYFLTFSFVDRDGRRKSADRDSSLQLPCPPSD
jgi:hypothetical protein